MNWTRLLAALLLLTGVAAPTALQALEFGVGVGSTTTWHVNDSARLAGQGVESGFALTLGLGGEDWRGELLLRTEDAYDYNGTDRWTEATIFGVAAARTLLERDWFRLDARAALLLASRTLTIDTDAASIDSWSPGLEIGAGAEVLLPRRVTRDRFRLGLRLDLGWTQIIGTEQTLELQTAVPAGANPGQVALGRWHEAGPMLRTAVVLRF